MAKKDPNKDSTTDFFLNFITRKKEETIEDDTREIKKEEFIVQEQSIQHKFLSTISNAINYINKTIDKLLSSNSSLKILSLILTIILVLTINGGSLSSVLSTPTSAEQFDNVEVQVEGLTEEYEITGVPEGISITAVGPSLDLYTAKTANNYQAYIDVTGLLEGEHTVEVKTRNFSDSIQVFVQPSTVTVKIKEKVTRTFKLGYHFENEEQMGGDYSAELISLGVDQVDVRGALDKINKIDRVDAVIDVAGETDNFSKEAQIYAYDASGQIVNVEITPNVVQASCKVSTFSKEVKIEPVYKGTLSSDLAIESVKLSTNSITIYGTKEALENINEVYVTIDIDGISESKSYTFNNLSISTVDGINRMSVDKVNATVEVSSSTTKAIESIPIVVNNNNNNYKVAYETGQDTVTLNVTGAKSVIDKLTSSDIIASIDVVGLETGKHEIQVKIKINKAGCTYEFVTPEKITITLN